MIALPSLSGHRYTRRFFVTLKGRSSFENKCTSRAEHLRYAALALDQSVIKRALERTLKRLGPDELSKRLGAPPELIQAWLNGHATVPERKVMALIDLIDEIGPPENPQR